MNPIKAIRVGAGLYKKVAPGLHVKLDCTQSGLYSRMSFINK